MNGVSVDKETETTILNLVHEAFRGATIIAIAHRLDTIMDYDTVLVMDSGRIVEQGNPRTLLASPTSAFSRVHRSQR